MPLGLTELEFRLEDRVAGETLTPDNVDIPTLRAFLDDIEKLIRGEESTASLEDSRIRIEEGSVKILALVAPIVASSLLADVSKVLQTLPRLIWRWVSMPNQRFTWLSQKAWVG